MTQLFANARRASACPALRAHSRDGIAGPRAQLASVQQSVCKSDLRTFEAEAERSEAAAQKVRKSDGVTGMSHIGLLGFGKQNAPT